MPDGIWSGWKERPPARMSFAAALAVGAIALVPPPALAQTHDADNLTTLESRAADVVDVLSNRTEPEGVFGPAFLADVPPAQLREMTSQLRSQFGEIIGVEAVDPLNFNRANVTFRFERALGSGRIDLDPSAPHLIAGLRLTAFEPLGDDADAIINDIASLPGQVSVWYGPLEGGAPYFAHQQGAQLAIGSTFKLYVLSAVAAQVAEGRLAWDQVVPLTSRSFPSGMLQDWPEGSALTVQTLATLMISISDNSATDQLIELVGREAVETELVRSGHVAPAASLPMLKTFELFALKGDLALARQYVDADQDGKRAILAQLAIESGGDPANIDPPTFSSPTMIDTLEWFGNTQDVRKVLKQIAAIGDPAALQILAVNPSLPRTVADDWSYVGYKGGSEPGVLNLSWMLRDRNGASHALIMSWNDAEAPLDHPTFELLAQRILSLKR